MSRRSLLTALLLLLPLCQAAPQERASDQYFAGTVISSSADQVVVSRILQGKAESKSFRLTGDTKVEGQLKVDTRVTVRFVTTEEGDTATLVIVRPPQAKGKK